MGSCSSLRTSHQERPGSKIRTRVYPTPAATTYGHRTGSARGAADRADRPRSQATGPAGVGGVQHRPAGWARTVRVHSGTVTSCCLRRASEVNPHRVRSRRYLCRIWCCPRLHLEVGQHGQHAAVVLRAFRKSELPEDTLNVLLDCAFGDEQSLRDRLVRATLGHERQHFPLPVAELLDRVVPSPGPPHEKRNDGGIEHRPTAADTPDGIGKLGEIGNPILEEVSDALGAVAQELEGIAGTCVLGEHEDAHIREARADLPRGAEAPIGIGGHTDIDDRDIGPKASDLFEEPRAIRGLPYDLESSFGQQPRHTLPDEDRIVGDHYAHGIVARISVPWPALLSNRSLPPSAWTRSVRPRIPVPQFGSAPPIPSSRTRTIRRPPCRTTVTSAVEACACFATLASPSAT